MPIHFSILFMTALVPLIIGFIWYHPKVFGNSWMAASGVTPDSAKGAGKALVFGLTYLFGLFLSMAINFMVNHDMHLYSLVADDPAMNQEGSETHQWLTASLEKYGTHFRTFKHGMFHGALGGITIVLPVIAVNALFERKSGKYIFINAGFWIVCMMIMGGIICLWA
ncbi:MAG: DUF1761 domain-containing protein [Bacteroidia bacterium]|nr:DUF1761 domain-containing protein [Bacteroidia bacterium]